MNSVVLISLPVDELQMLITSCVNNCLKYYEPQHQEKPRYITTHEAAEYLGKTSNALRVMVHKNQIKSIKKGNSLYFLESDLIDYLESGRRSETLHDNCEAVLTLARVAEKKKGVTN
jgi:excisionase family DNA binding protein